MMRKKFWPLIFSAGEDGGKHQRKGEGDDGDDHHEQDHILHGADELGVPQQMLEVFQPDKGLVVDE